MSLIDSVRIMYEIYRESGYDARHRVVYFTELTDRNKEAEINRAIAGRHVHDGFIREWRKEEAKAIIEEFVGHLNAGEPLPPAELATALEALGGS